MGNDIAKMHARQNIVSSGSGECVCHSAIIRCPNGSKDCVLNLKVDHGKYVGNVPVIDSKDGKSVNFGYCTALKDACAAEISDWVNANSSDLVQDDSAVMMLPSVQKDEAFTVCTSGHETQVAVTSGQSEFQTYGTSESKYEEIRVDYDFILYEDIWTGVIGGPPREISIICDKSSRKLIHIRIQNNGYYQFRMYTDDGKSLEGSQLTVYRNASRKGEFDELYPRKYIETTYESANTFRTLIFGDVDYNKMEKRIRYATQCYMFKGTDYYVEYWVNGVEKFNLIFGVYAAQLQYDITNPVANMIKEDPNEWNSIEKAAGTMLGDTVIAPCLSPKSLLDLFNTTDYPFDKIAKGMFCGLIWELDQNCKLSGPHIDGEYGNMVYYYRSPMKILYLDQMLGGWLYSKMDYIYHNIKDNKENRERFDSFKEGMGQSGIAALGGWIAQKMAEMTVYAAYSTSASIAAGLVITAVLLVADALNDKTSFENMLSKFRGFVQGDSTRNALSTPVVFVIEKHHNLTVTVDADTKFHDVFPWDGRTVSAVGGNYHCGQYSYCYTCETQLSDYYNKLLEEMKLEFEDN